MTKEPTTERTVIFLTRLINDNRLRGYLFLMDNAGAHKDQSIRALIADSGTIWLKQCAL